MTKAVEIEHLIEVLGYIGDELSNIADKPTVEINKEGVTPSEVATTLTQGDTTYSVGGGGGAKTELIIGNMQASFTTSTPSYVLPGQLGAWQDLPEGKHFSDYDEIMLVVIYQMTPTVNSPQRYTTMSVPTWMLDTGNNLQDLGVEIASTNSSTGARVAIRKDDKYNVEWYNYGSPIALLGIKY